MGFGVLVLSSFLLYFGFVIYGIFFIEENTQKPHTKLILPLHDMEICQGPHGPQGVSGPQGIPIDFLNPEEYKLLIFLTIYFKKSEKIQNIFYY
jgi:hypothetical protein